MRVLAVEDDGVVFRNWRRLLDGRVELEQASTFDEAWHLTGTDTWKQRPYHNVLLDLRLPDGDGEDLLDRLAGLSPQPGVAIISGFLDARRVLSLHGRCSLIIPKPADGEALWGILGILDQARNGRSVVTEFARQHRLSPQETRLLLAAIRDASNDEAADELGCTSSTVRTYWTRILSKTGCASAREVVVHLFQFAIDPNSPRSPANGAPPH